MALNNTYSLTPQPYAPGMVADARMTQTVSRIASAAIKAGQAAVRDNNDHKVKPVSAADDVVIGVVRWEATWVAADGATEQTHAIGKDVSVVTDGPVWVHATVAVEHLLCGLGDAVVKKQMRILLSWVLDDLRHQCW